MARILQIRRGTTAQNDNFTGLAGELSFDTDTKTMRVHDGEKLGGYALARADEIANAAPTFDISDVPDEFWESLFARFGGTSGDTAMNMMESAGLPLLNDERITYLFNTNAVAKFADVFLTCRVAEAGYAPGDICHTFGIGDYCAPRVSTYNDDRGLRAFVAVGGQSYWVAHRETGVRTNVTNNRWQVKIRVYC